MTSCPVGSILSSLDSLEKVIFPTSRQKKKVLVFKVREGIFLECIFIITAS